MNAPSNFAWGKAIGCTSPDDQDFNLDNPPYIPSITEGLLYAKSICPSSQQYLGKHYDLHSLYGYFEGKATSKYHFK